MKFDVIVGNPPYQPPIDRKDIPREGSGSGNRIWHLFVERAVALLNDGGYLGFVHPNGWRGISLKTKDQLKPAKDKLMNGNIIWVLINADIYFQIGQSLEVDAYVFQNSSEYSKTTVKNAINGYQVDLNIKETAIPTRLSEESISIIKHITSQSADKIKIQITPRKFASNADFIVSERDEEHRYEFLNTSAQYTKGKRLWSSVPHPLQDKTKIIFCDSGAEGFILDDGRFGCCHHTHCILVDSVKEGEALLDFLKSDPVQMFLSFFRKEGSMYAPTHAIAMLPKITQKLTPKETYALFGLTLGEN
jgi:hypothetical protein